jgi:uncharacterized lipoprotein YmbA
MKRLLIITALLLAACGGGDPVIEGELDSTDYAPYYPPGWTLTQMCASLNPPPWELCFQLKR